MPEGNKVFQYEGIRSSNDPAGGKWQAENMSLRMDDGLNAGGEF
jgi:hypothetical protein